MRPLFGLAIALAATLPACMNEHHPEFHPESSYSYSQNISQPVTVFSSGSQTPVGRGESHHGDDHHDDDAPAGPMPAYARDPAQILVLQTKHLDRPAEVIGVVDAHEAMGKHEAALWALRTKAARLGADAVVGVEFHHGESEGEPTHLSGLAVRFLRGAPYPVD